MVMLNRKAQAGNGRLALCQLSPPVKEILETTHLDELLNIYATEQEAVQSFEYRGTSEDIGVVVHSHPTLSEAVKEAALGVLGRSIHI